MNTAAKEVNWKNVGNWHWVDKNCVNWATEYFQTSLKTTVDSQEIQATFDKVSGDCDLNQRKSQIISIFDLCIKGSWTITEKEKQLWKGSIEIPEFMHDTTMDELVINIDIDSTAKESQDIKNKVRKHVTPLIKEKFSHFAADLMLAHSKDVYITQDEMKGHPVKQQYTPKPPVSEIDKKSTKPSTQVGGLVTVNQKITFQATATDLYEVLLNPKKVTVWTRAPCIIEKTVGSSFSLFGGNITGKIVELVADEKIVMSWRLKTWSPDHESLVTISLHQGTENTELKLSQANVPIGEKNAVEQNWNNYFWNSIKRTFGFGALL